jgi:hypothetical protein
LAERGKLARDDLDEVRREREGSAVARHLSDESEERLVTSVRSVGRRNREGRVDRRREVARTREESCEPCEWHRNTGEGLNATKIVENELAIALVHVGDPDIAPAAARPPHEVISAEIDAEPPPRRALSLSLLGRGPPQSSMPWNLCERATSRAIRGTLPLQRP